MSVKKLDITYYYCPVQNTAFQRFTLYDPDVNVWHLILVSFEEQQKDKVRFGTQIYMRRVDNKSYEIHQQCTDPEIEFEVKRLTHKQAAWWLFSNGFPLKVEVVPEELFKYYESTMKYLDRSFPKDPDR